MENGKYRADAAAYRAAGAASGVSCFLTSFICLIIGILIKNDFWTGLVPIIWLVGIFLTTWVCLVKKLMKDTKTKEKFIQLRAEGMSFDKIVRELDTSKPTLMKWAKEFENEISELMFIEFESLFEKYKMLRLERVRRYGEQLKLIREALKEKDLKDVPATKLLDMALVLEDRIQGEMKEVSHGSVETKPSIDELMVESPKYTWHID